MAILSNYAKLKKIKFFIKKIPKNASVLEIGCGSGWLREYMTKNGWQNYVGIDINEPADIVGDILEWEDIGIKRTSYDYIIAFEVIEHVNCFKEAYEILKPNGKLLLTSPLPYMDWLCKIFEYLGLNQKRTSPHNNLIYFKEIPYLTPITIKTIGFMSQWGIFKK